MWWEKMDGQANNDNGEVFLFIEAKKGCVHVGVAQHDSMKLTEVWWKVDSRQLTANDIIISLELEMMIQP